MDTYIISLENPVELIEKSKKLDLNPIIVAGVNGNQLTDEIIQENTKASSWSFVGSTLTPKSAIGIAMSHVKAWKEFLKTTEKAAIFLEDDAIFDSTFKNDFPKILTKLPNDSDILLLGCFFCDPNYNNISFMNCYNSSNISSTII